MNWVCYFDVEKAICGHTTKGVKIKGLNGHKTFKNKVHFQEWKKKIS